MNLNDSEGKAAVFLTNTFRSAFSDVRVLRNVLIRVPEGSAVPTAEFDCIIVCNGGVYCFEIKNWQHCALIRQKSEAGHSDWFLEYEDRRVKVADPMAQGGHKVRALKAHLVSDMPVRYYVLLPTSSVRIPATMPPSVICSHDLPYVVRMCRSQAKSSTKPMLSSDDVDLVASYIANLSKGLTLEDHVANCCAYEASKNELRSRSPGPDNLEYENLETRQAVSGCKA